MYLKQDFKENMAGNCSQEKVITDLLQNRCCDVVFRDLIVPLYQERDKMTLWQILPRTFMGLKQTSLPRACLSRARAVPASTVLTHTLRSVHSDQLLAMPTLWIFLVSVAWVCRLTLHLSYLFIVFISRVHFFKCFEFSPLLFRWRHQNENISRSTLLYPKTKQNCAHKLQAVWGSPWERHCALVPTKKRGALEANPLWLNQE